MVGKVLSAAVSKPPLIHAYIVNSDALRTANAALHGALASCAFWQNAKENSGALPLPLSQLTSLCGSMSD